MLQNDMNVILYVLNLLSFLFSILFSLHRPVLTVLWEKPEERLKNVASTDITLMDELNGVGECATPPDLLFIYYY